ncbi:hypothetical protein [Streptomyces sp. NY05-11A]|uniref:hypothetical protein n=1 Tax=Streptomyces soliscabiei TaxID=588897 RepID=UPI0039F6C04E
MLTAHPDRLIQGTGDDLARAPGAYIEAAGRVYAGGRDPFFPPWPDVVQLNAFSERLRAATVDTLVAIGDRRSAIGDRRSATRRTACAATWRCC